MSDDLARLSRALRPVVVGGDGDPVISDEDSASVLDALESPLRERLQELMTEIRSAVPTDFEFSIAFEFAGIRLNVDFQDGNTGTFGPGSFFTSRKSMMRKLRSTNWDERRADGISRGDIFDEMLSESEDRPANIPSTAEAAARHSIALSAAIAEVRHRDPIPPFAVITFREDRGVEIDPRRDRDDVRFTIGNAVATSYDILAILERGLEWPNEDVEAFKRRVIEGLGPISRAKAEGRFFL